MATGKAREHGGRHRFEGPAHRWVARLCFACARSLRALALAGHTALAGQVALVALVGFAALIALAAASGAALGQAAQGQAAQPDASGPAPAAGEAASGPAGLFDPSVLATVPEGQTLAFSHTRSADPADPRLPDFAGRVEITIARGENGARTARVAFAAGDGRREGPVYPADAGHPLLPLFLENTVQLMAEATGGNPTYIRTRLRDALWLEAERRPLTLSLRGETILAEAWSVTPFAEDANRARMGGFAALTLEIVLSEAVPGRYVRLRMRTGADGNLPVLTEMLALEGLE